MVSQIIRLDWLYNRRPVPDLVEESFDQFARPVKMRAEA